MNRQDLTPHSLLPAPAILALQRAASVPVEKDPHARAKAIDMATDQLRRTYPDLFVPDGG